MIQGSAQQVINKEILLMIYDASHMIRWNDQVRSVEMTELDKQAHKMITAFVLGKLYKSNIKKGFWLSIIEAGFFEFLQRIVLTDLKPQLFHEIKKDSVKYKKLNQWVYKRIQPSISILGEPFCKRFREYINDDNTESIVRKIIGASHFYVTKWEYEIISRFNPNLDSVNEIKKSIEDEQEKYKDLKALEALLKDERLKRFIDICGQLRFQIRWSHLYRIPRTSVLGHMLVVALFSYVFSSHAKASEEMITNNYFTGLFHDLPEVLTRDIINPVKRSVEGLDKLIKGYEKKEMDKKIYNLIPVDWYDDIKRYTENEFDDIDNRSGSLVKAADDLAAFIEAYLCLRNGIKNNDMVIAKKKIIDKYKGKEILGIDLDGIYSQFK